MRIFIAVLGVLCIADGLIAMSISNHNFGNVLPVFIGVAFIVYGLLRKKYFELTQEGVGRKIRICVNIMLITGCVVVVVLTAVIAVGSQSKAEAGADVVVVLGAGLRGDAVTRTLANRLDKAMEYMADNPNTIALVSGGQGSNEMISEAEAMKRYMVANGIAEDRVIKEDRSSNTYQNFLYSKQILDGLLGETYRVVFVTNDFHIFRSGYFAKMIGLDASGLPAPSPTFLIPNLYLREYFSIIKAFVLRQY